MGASGSCDRIGGDGAAAGPGLGQGKQGDNTNASKLPSQNVTVARSRLYVVAFLSFRHRTVSGSDYSADPGPGTIRCGHGRLTKRHRSNRAAVTCLVARSIVRPWFVRDAHAVLRLLLWFGRIPRCSISGLVSNTWVDRLMFALWS